MICVSMGNSGLNDVNGSWGMNVIARPRTRSFTAAGSSRRRSVPLKRTSPARMRAAPSGRMPRIARARVVLPQPLSPTSPTTSPVSMSRFIPSSTCAGPRSVAKSTRNPRTASSSAIARRAAAAQPRIEHIAQAVAEQVEAHDGEEDRQARRRRVPPRVRQELARLRDRPPPLRRRRRGGGRSRSRASSCRTRGGTRRRRAWRSSSPSWASTCSATACAMCSIRGCAAAARRAMAELLAVRGLRVDFATDRGPAQVLDGMNLDIETGEVVGLVGESGCGKTTLARAILGILPEGAARIRAGEVRFKGTDLLREDPGAVNDRVRGRAITFIPQDPFTSFSPVFPIETQIMDLMKWKSPRAGNGGGPASILGRYPRARHRADREAVLEILRAVQIPEPARALRRLPHEFSGGQRQRLMIAMALLPRPDLIIADEPTAALDVTIQAQILRLLRTLVKERGVSVLFTTHDLGTAHEICDRVVVMYAGQEMEAAPADAFFARPAHPYTRRLLASVPR